MDTKQLLGLIFTLLGAIGLGFGVIALFNGGEALGQNPWGVGIVGLVFFLAGMSLMRTVKG